MTDYSASKYWSTRYGASPHDFDWLAPPAALVPFLLPLLLSDSEVLIPGCGTSQLAPELYQAGVRNLSCIDRAEEAIAYIAERDAALQEMDFSVLDACNMRGLPDACFDAVSTMCFVRRCPSLHRMFCFDNMPAGGGQGAAGHRGLWSGRWYSLRGARA